MRSKVAVYDTHDEIVKAAKALSDSGIPSKHISIIGKAGMAKPHVHLINMRKVEKNTLFVIVGMGVLAGLLSGLGFFPIPVFNFLEGAGVAVGIIGGFMIGLIAGGLVVLLEMIVASIKYRKPLVDGKFILVINGPTEEVDKAEKILHTEGAHFILE